MIIEKIDLDDVYIKDKQRYNSNNHWFSVNFLNKQSLTVNCLNKNQGEQLVRPSDYMDKIYENRTSNWVDKFKEYNFETQIGKNQYTKLIIHDVKWLKLISRLNRTLGHFSKLYEDDLNEFVENYKSKIENCNCMSLFNLDVNDNKIPYFVRTENVSLKTGHHGIGPYYTFKQIIESLVTCSYGHTPLTEDTNEIVIYLFEWIDIKPYNEFRVFVNNSRITAISQQNLYSKYDELQINHNDGSLELKLNNIVSYFNTTIKNRFDQKSFTFDFAFTCTDLFTGTSSFASTNQFTSDGALINVEPYFIEPNCFGKEYAAGSSLFHWIIDEDILYGKHNEIYFRYTI